MRLCVCVCLCCLCRPDYFSSLLWGQVIDGDVIDLHQLAAGDEPAICRTTWTHKTSLCCQAWGRERSCCLPALTTPSGFYSSDLLSSDTNADFFFFFFTSNRSLNKAHGPTAGTPAVEPFRSAPLRKLVHLSSLFDFNVIVSYYLSSPGLHPVLNG